jgi:hypothetical protein
MRKLLILTPLFLVLGFNVCADDAPTIVGTWRLVSTAATTVDGQSVASPMGEHPTGLLTYTADGRIRFQDADGTTGAGEGDRGRQSIGPGADHDRIGIRSAHRFDLGPEIWRRK